MKFINFMLHNINDKILNINFIYSCYIILLMDMLNNAISVSLSQKANFLVVSPFKSSFKLNSCSPFPRRD